MGRASIDKIDTDSKGSQVLVELLQKAMTTFCSVFEWSATKIRCSTSYDEQCSTSYDGQFWLSLPSKDAVTVGLFFEQEVLKLVGS
jgi:hypothetical protein